MHRLLLAATVTATVALAAACGGEVALSADLVTRGDQLFHGEATCQTCHGADLQGTSMGPSFLDQIYAPDHHPDSAFHAAVRNGVRPHHGDYGPMPALPHLDEEEVDAIVAYVRSRQRAAGIE